MQSENKFKVDPADPTESKSHRNGLFRRFIFGEDRRLDEREEPVRPAPPRSKPPAEIPLMTYESVVDFFVTRRPQDPRVVCGALLRRHQGKRYHLTQVFLDRDMKPVAGPSGKLYGREIAARRLDDELSDAFGRENLIIFD